MEDGKKQAKKPKTKLRELPKMYNFKVTEKHKLIPETVSKETNKTKK